MAKKKEERNDDATVGSRYELLTRATIMNWTDQRVDASGVELPTTPRLRVGVARVRRNLRVPRGFLFRERRRRRGKSFARGIDETTRAEF